MYLILLLCKRLNISSKMVPEILAKKQRISFCCGPCANTQSLLQNGGIAMREILVPSLFCFGFLVVALTRVNNANHQIILGPSVTHQKCYYSPHGCYSKNCSVHIPFKEFSSIPKHSNAFISFHSLPLQSYDCPYQCHLLGYSCGTSDAKDSEALWQNSPNSNPFRKEASTFNTIQKRSNKSKNNTIWKTRKHSNEKTKRPVTFFSQEHSMNISNIHKQTNIQHSQKRHLGQPTHV